MRDTSRGISRACIIGKTSYQSFSYSIIAVDPSILKRRRERERQIQRERLKRGYTDIRRPASRALYRTVSRLPSTSPSAKCSHSFGLPRVAVTSRRVVRSFVRSFLEFLDELRKVEKRDSRIGRSPPASSLLPPGNRCRSLRLFPLIPRNIP